MPFMNCQPMARDAQAANTLHTKFTYKQKHLGDANGLLGKQRFEDLAKDQYRWGKLRAPTQQQNIDQMWPIGASVFLN